MQSSLRKSLLRCLQKRCYNTHIGDHVDANALTANVVAHWPTFPFVHLLFVAIKGDPAAIILMQGYATRPTFFAWLASAIELQNVEAWERLVAKLLRGVERDVSQRSKV